MLRRPMEDPRTDLTETLRTLYKRGGMKVTSSNGLLEAAGPGGVTWIGRAVVREDFDAEEFEAEIIELAGRRMERGGELCPLDLLPDAACESELRDLLRRTGLDQRPHVAVYTAAA